MALGARGLGRQARLRRTTEFQRVGRVGRHRSSESFAVVVADRDERARGSGPRLGVTVSRRVGGAVTRNRVKRNIREWFRKRRAQLGEGTDVVVIARRAAAALRSNEMERELSRLLEEHLRDGPRWSAPSPAP